jgi:dethiobiotin synthetase
MTLDLIVRMRLPVVLAARPGLGTINHTMLSVAVLRARHCSIKGIVLSGGKGGLAEKTNPDVLRQLTRIPVFAIPNGPVHAAAEWILKTGIAGRLLKF